MTTTRGICGNIFMKCLFCKGIAPQLLMQVILLLALFNGSALATAARLKWDPSTYIILRLIFPTEYHVIGCLLAFGGFSSIFIGQMVIIALTMGYNGSQTCRRGLFFTYAAMMLIVILVELSSGIYISLNIWAWMNKKPMIDIMALVEEIRDDPLASFIVNAVLKILSEANIPLRELITEIWADIPINIFILIACIIMVAMLQPLSIFLSLNAAYSDCKSVKKSNNIDTSNVTKHIVSNKNYQDPIDKKFKIVP